MSIFVDANVFLRFLLDDDQRQASQAEVLFTDAKAGKVDLLCGPPVLFEMAWTLRSTYGHGRVKVLETLQSLMAMSGIRFLDRDLIESALQIAEAHQMEFADAYIAASAQKHKAALATFNTKDFKRSGLKLRTLNGA